MPIMLSTAHRICKCSRFSLRIVRFASETSEKKEDWPSETSEKKEEWPLIDTAFLKTSSFERKLDRFHLNKWNLFSKTFSQRFQTFRRNRDVQKQRYDADRAEMLGPNLSAMYAILRSGGVVKLVGQEDVLTFRKARFILEEKNPSLQVEAIDLRNIEFYYEGLENLRDLPTLKWLNISGNNSVDNWYLDYLGYVAPNLEYLNISRCTNVDHNGLYCLYKFTNLKYLNVENVSDTVIFKGMCATIEAEKSDLCIVGYVSNEVPRKSAFNDYI